MFIENIIESLPDDKCLCLAKHLGIEENRAFIAKKKLIKVAHAIKKQSIRVISLDAHVVLEHGGHLECGFRHGGAWGKRA